MTRNVWGTDRALINADEFCPDCEREVPGHYANCPTRARCEWCGERGHDYTVHAEAVAQAEAWHPDGDDARQELSGWLTD